MRDSMFPTEAAQLKELLNSGLTIDECCAQFPMVEPDTIKNFYPSEEKVEKVTKSKKEVDG
jgi:uncharacterized protein (DUF433 family)